MSVTVVVGGGGDIGRKIVARLREGGEKVATWDLRPDPAAGGTDLFVSCDVTDPADVERATRETVAQLGPVTALVNAAGVSQYDDFLDLTAEQWSRIVEIDLVGPANTVRAVLPGMLEAGAGTVVNICSIWSTRSGIKRSAYVAAKWGLLGLTRCLSDEFRDRGIRFTAVSPGPVLTQMTEPFVSPDEAATWMRPAEVADVVQFALSPAGRSLVGSEIEIYGWGRPAGVGA